VNRRFVRLMNSTNNESLTMMVFVPTRWWAAEHEGQGFRVAPDRIPDGKNERADPGPDFPTVIRWPTDFVKELAFDWKSNRVTMLALSFRPAPQKSARLPRVRRGDRAGLVVVIVLVPVEPS
jgi:hypothetical protein